MLAKHAPQNPPSSSRLLMSKFMQDISFAAISVEAHVGSKRQHLNSFISCSRIYKYKLVLVKKYLTIVHDKSHNVSCYHFDRISEQQLLLVELHDFTLVLKNFKLISGYNVSLYKFFSVILFLHRYTKKSFKLLNFISIYFYI